MSPGKDNEGFSISTSATETPIDTTNSNTLNITARNAQGWPTANADGYQILESPYGTRRKLRVIHIGGGASGICFSKFAEDRLRDVEVQIYEKNGDVGGTWLENRYPGCACDIPSASYQFTWERNPNWTQYYSESPEIWQYFKDVAVKHDLLKYMKFEHKVVGAYWDEARGKWDVHVEKLGTSSASGGRHERFVDSCDVLINGGGILNNWKWPDIQGLHDFKGVLTHSARYDTSLDLSGKRVAVVGMGSSGIQIVSKIASQVKQLYTWVRSPTWITAGFAQKFAGPDGGNFKYTEQQKKIFQDDPELFKRYSKMIESELNVRFKFILKDTPEAQAAKEFARNEMMQKLAGNDELMGAMIPKNFGIGCRRPTPGNGFLEALNRDNVQTFTTEMKAISERGFIASDGQEYEVDVIICATGFNTTWIPPFEVQGEQGRTLAKEWKHEPSSYISIAVPNFPNYWMMVGPYGPLGHGSFLPIVENLSGNIIQCIEKLQRENIKSMAPKEEVAKSFAKRAQLFLQRTAWTSPCSSWFKQGKIDGPLPMFPASRLVYIDLLKNPRFEDYEIEYEGGDDMWRFLGNGFATREFDGRDLSYYLGLLDGKDVQEDLEGELHGKLSELVH